MSDSGKWLKIKEHYALFGPIILAGVSHEWEIDPYAWDYAGSGINMTPIERNLWADARNVGAILYPQWPTCGYFLDFANPVAMVGIECDGAAYHTDKERDAKRQRHLEDNGWTIYRISGRDCNTDFDDETKESSAATKFIEEICSKHDIRRRVIKASGPVKISELLDSVIDRLLARSGIRQQTAR